MAREADIEEARKQATSSKMMRHQTVLANSPFLKASLRVHVRVTCVCALGSGGKRASGANERREKEKREERNRSERKERREKDEREKREKKEREPREERKKRERSEKKGK